MAERATPVREAGPLLGRLLELDVGAVAAGGSCVARHGESGRVVFVRHALPGERVRALVTDDRGGSFCRADAVEIVTAAPQRVAAPCEYAGPGRCGGCDWQHASGDAQRELKASVIREQFARIGGLDVTELLDRVEELPGGLLGWRTRIAYAVDAAGRPGLHRHGSHDVEHVARCLLGVPGVGDAAALTGRWPGLSGVEVVRGDDGALTTVAHRRGRRTTGRRRPADQVEVVAGPARVTRRVGRAGDLPVDLGVAAAGFWQVHPAALDVLSGALLAAVAPAAGETVLELFAGAGALTTVLANAVGPDGLVMGLEGDRQAVADAATNLAPWPLGAGPPRPCRRPDRSRRGQRAGFGPGRRGAGPAAGRRGGGGHRRAHRRRTAGDRLCVLRSGHPGPRRRGRG